MMQGIKDILDALKQLQSTIYLACDEKPADDISKIVRDAVTEITSLRAELEIAKKDGERNSWMVKHNAYISWSQDSEVCSVWIIGDNRDDMGDYPAQGYPQKSYNTVEEAIDNAMKGKE